MRRTAARKACSLMSLSTVNELRQYDSSTKISIFNDFETDICGELLRFFLWAEADIQNFTTEFFHAGGDN